MPRPRPPNLHRETTRHKKSVWYVRIGKGPRIRMHADFGTTEFDLEYKAAIDGKPKPGKNEPAAQSLSWLVKLYRNSSAWSALSPATQGQRDNILDNVCKTAGHQPYTAITPATVIAGRERRSKTPHAARHFLDAMRGLFEWAVESQITKKNPTIGVKNPPRNEGDGFPPWTEEWVEKYEKRWPVGTRQRVWLDVILYTGLRRGDAVRLGRQHIRDGIATIRTEKTGEIVTLPILPVLARTLRAGPCGDLTFIAGERRQPLTKESFGNLFREACRKAKVPGSAHGVRKIAATRAANSGATTAQLEAIFGWSGGTMASLYTRSADRQRLAKEAMHKLANDDRTSIPAPRSQVRARKQKSK